MGTEIATDRIALSARDVARMLAISERQVWRMASDGRLPRPGQVGHRKRWDRGTLLAWWSEQQGARR
ncbi:MAG: helix-turn-helix transcriptional regulator [Planctomycetota bacterium]|jgi:predicted DNA-binding transcriptional regulator AlpA